MPCNRSVDADALLHPSTAASTRKVAVHAALVVAARGTLRTAEQHCWRGAAPSANSVSGGRRSHHPRTALLFLPYVGPSELTGGWPWPLDVVIRGGRYFIYRPPPGVPEVRPINITWYKMKQGHT